MVYGFVYFFGGFFFVFLSFYTKIRKIKKTVDLFILVKLKGLKQLLVPHQGPLGERLHELKAALNLNHQPTQVPEMSAESDNVYFSASYKV